MELRSGKYLFESPITDERGLVKLIFIWLYYLLLSLNR
jgi:hypothetical protein